MASFCNSNLPTVDVRDELIAGTSQAATVSSDVGANEVEATDSSALRFIHPLSFDLVFSDTLRNDELLTEVLLVEV